MRDIAPADAVASGLAAARQLGSPPVAAAGADGRAVEPAILAATGAIPFEGEAAGYVLDWPSGLEAARNDLAQPELNWGSPH